MRINLCTALRQETIVFQPMDVSQMVMSQSSYIVSQGSRDNYTPRYRLWPHRMSTYSGEIDGKEYAVLIGVIYIKLMTFSWYQIFANVNQEVEKQKQKKNLDQYFVKTPTGLLPVSRVIRACYIASKYHLHVSNIWSRVVVYYDF